MTEPGRPRAHYLDPMVARAYSAGDHWVVEVFEHTEISRVAATKLLRRRGLQVRYMTLDDNRFLIAARG